MVVRLFLISTTFLFAACKQNTKEVCSTCVRHAPNENKLINIAGKQIETEIWNSDSGYVFAYGKYEDLPSILGSVDSPHILEREIASLVLYCDSKEMNNVRNIDIVGYGIYFNQGGKLRYSFRLKESGSYKTITELNSLTGSQTTNNIYGIADIFFHDKINSISAVVIADEKLLFKYTNTNINPLTEKIKSLREHSPQ